MADINKDKLSAPASPLPSSKSPIPPSESSLAPEEPVDPDMEADVDTKVATCHLFYLSILQKFKVYTEPPIILQYYLIN